MRTPEQLQARRTRRKAQRFLAEHPRTPKAADPLHNAVLYLQTLRCDDTTTRQDVLPK